MMRLRKSNNLDLPLASAPTSSSSSSSWSSNNKIPDGSGKGIGIEFPSIVKVIKESSIYTRVTYTIIVLCILMIWFGIRTIRFNNASIWLICDENESCRLEFTAPGWSKTTKIPFEREHLIRTDIVKVDPNGNILETNPPMLYHSTHNDNIHHNHGKKGYYNNKKKAPIIGGHKPDVDGNYESYTIILAETNNNNNENNNEDIPHLPKDGKLHDLMSIISPFKGEYIIHMRMYTLGHSKRRARSMQSKIRSYISGARKSLRIKEQRNVSWIGLISIILSFFCLVITCLLGELWESDDSVTGPGLRNQQQQQRQQKLRQQQQQQQRSGTLRQSTTTTAQRPISGRGGGVPQQQAYGGYRPSSSSSNDKRNY